MNLVQQYASFAEDFASLIRWIRECGYLLAIEDAENMSAQLKIFSYDSYKEVDENIYKEIGSYWIGISALNRWQCYNGTLKFERKEIDG